MRLGITVLAVSLVSALSFAEDDNKHTYLMNYDLNIIAADTGEIHSRIRQAGVRLEPVKPFHGDNLEEIEYFLTISRFENGQGKLTIEVYQFKTRRKESDVISEVVVEVDFALASPGRFEGANNKLGVDLAFSIVQE